MTSASVSAGGQTADFPDAATAQAEAEPEPAEHRSGVAGVPFFNLVGYMEDAQLSASLVQLMRDEWLGEAVSSQPGLLGGLESALADAAEPGSRDVVLTFANSGYADFVLNGFEREVVPSTLIIALDAAAHDKFVAAGLHSFFDPRMPSMAPSPAYHASAAFMDIMKLRLLYLAEVLLRGYNALLTDADAVFYAPPFAVLPPGADLVVACDSTVVPKTWAEAPGMVMAGFFYAKAGPRPIVLLKEVLDYQVRHPLQHDQQSFNQILSELLVADLNVRVMHPRLFPNGFQYFVKRTAQREGVSPLVVQNNWIMGAENKRHRFREARMWSQDEPEYYRGTRDAPLKLLRYDPTQPGVSGLRRETSALRAALRIAVLLNRTLVLPRTCAFASASGLVPAPPLEYRDKEGDADTNVLDDSVDADWCTAEWFYDMGALKQRLGGWYRESAFLEHPLAKAHFGIAGGTAGGTAGGGAGGTAGGGATSRFHIEAAAAWRVGSEDSPPSAAAGGEADATGASSKPKTVVLTPSDLEAGATDDEIRAWFLPHQSQPVLDLGDLAGRVQMPSRTSGGMQGAGGAAAVRAHVELGPGSEDQGFDDEGQAGDARHDTPEALTERILGSVIFREEILRHVRQQVQVASPFDCLCVQGGGLDGLPPSRLRPIVDDFRARVPTQTAVFVAGYRLDLDGRIAPFQAAWPKAYALALYDWNGAGLSGRQFSSVINRLICQKARTVHFVGNENGERAECD